MLKFVTRLLLIAALLPVAACAESEPTNAKYVEGKHYVKLAEPIATDNQDKIEVLESFWYGCPGCYALETYVRPWAKQLPADVEFVKMPSMLNGGWRVHAQAYYAAKALGLADKNHEKLFDAIHKERRKLFDLNALTDFYVENGADRKLFNGKLKSFAVDGVMKKAFKKQVILSKGGVRSVPALIVNGKYYVSGSMAAGSSGLFDVIDYLIEQERAAAK